MKLQLTLKIDRQNETWNTYAKTAWYKESMLFRKMKSNRKIAAKRSVSVNTIKATLDCILILLYKCSLAPVRFYWNYPINNHAATFVTDGWGISCEFAFKWELKISQASESSFTMWLFSNKHIRLFWSLLLDDILFFNSIPAFLIGDVTAILMEIRIYCLCSQLRHEIALSAIVLPIGTVSILVIASLYHTFNINSFA